jgi:hypothetical protein
MLLDRKEEWLAARMEDLDYIALCCREASSTWETIRKRPPAQNGAA